MLMFDHTNYSFKKIKRSDIQFFTKQLHRFLHIYQNKVSITDEASKQTIYKLRQILELLEREDYSALMNDTSIIENDCIPLDIVIDDDSFPI